MEYMERIPKKQDYQLLEFAFPEVFLLTKLPGACCGKYLAPDYHTGGCFMNIKSLTCGIHKICDPQS